MTAKTQYNHIRIHIPIRQEIEKYTALTQGENGYFHGECPFCKPPTGGALLFKVNTQKEIFYCQVCHKGGDIITFTCLKNGISPYEALEKLSEQHEKCMDCVAFDILEREIESEKPTKIGDIIEFEKRLKESLLAVAYVERKLPSDLVPKKKKNKSQ